MLARAITQSVARNTYDVCIEISVDLTRQHVETWPFHVERLEVADAYELSRSRAVVCNVQAAASNATVRAWLRRTGCFGVCRVEDTEILRDTTVAPHIAASLEWAGVELVDLRHVARGRGTRDGRYTRSKRV
jgi:hypothetical protein